MAKVIANMSMSLDGFIAHSDDSVGHLFDWYGNGDVTIETVRPGLTFKVSETSAAHIRQAMDSIGAFVIGRRLFDLTNGWDGKHPFGAVPIFVLTHSVPENWEHMGNPLFTFVTDGLESAIAQAKAAAGDKWVGVGSKVASQCLDAGLLDEIHVELVPVLLGEGIPFFENLSRGPFLLEDPEIVQDARVTHMRYRVKGR